MSRFNVIDPSRLGPMIVLEKIEAEAILAARMARLKARWTELDPPLGAEYDVEGLEFDPLKINQEASTYFEIMLRDRVNQAARAVTLAFGAGTDLDAIASRYPGGVPRLAGETDDRYRRRVWLSVNALSPHGTAEAYQFWALSAINGLLRDVTTLKLRASLEDHPLILITCLLEGPEPKPTQSQLLAIREYVLGEARTGLTDVISVAPPKVREIKYRIRLWLYPGPDAPSVVTLIRQRLEALIVDQYWLGHDHTRMAIHAATAVGGVANAIIDEPATDIATPPDWVVKVTGIELEVVGRTE